MKCDNCGADTDVDERSWGDPVLCEQCWKDKEMREEAEQPREPGEQQ